MRKGESVGLGARAHGEVGRWVEYCSCMVGVHRNGCGRGVSLSGKADFEKAFDSVRWDYLDGVLNNFGFGVKLRGWIQACLSSAMGSILVNESPSSEFKFHKGLKRRDPLSHFLFILVMESLHISFNNILNSGLYKGIRIDESLMLSHLFYADDTVFIGKWDKANVITIVNMLKCFYLASGLKINIQRSKIMGIGTSQEEVDAAANVIGCNKFSSPFNYLGVKVGSSSSRSNFWDEFRSKDSSLWYRVIKAMYGDYRALDNTEEQFSKLIEDVNSVTLSISNDRWIWSLDSSGEFSIKSTRLYIDDHLLLAVGAPTRWVKEVSIKINIMAWKLCNPVLIFFSLVLWPETLLPNWLDGRSLIARIYSHTMTGLNGFTLFVSLKVLRIYWKVSFTSCG
nr:RNA-directed DNA polymerase, eukaryota [Tanacetum cinerariifolium]